MHMRQSARSVRQAESLWFADDKRLPPRFAGCPPYLHLILGFGSAPPQALCRRRASRAQGKLSLQPPSVNY